MNSARWMRFGYGYPLAPKVEFSSNFPVHKTEPPYHPPANSAKARGVSGMIVARVTLVIFGGVERVNRAVTAAATALGGWGRSNPLIFSTSRRTCICRILFFDSMSEYPFVMIAAGIFILVSGLMWLSHIKKNLAVFAAQQST
jgi:hypothetical protein